MSDAHLHQIKLLTLCKGNPGAISVMLELMKRYHFSEEYYKCCDYLEEHKIHGEELYLLWKQTCEKDYERFLRYYFV